MTLGRLLEEGTSRLAQAGVAEADLDARYLLLHVTGLSAALFLAKRGQEAEENTIEAFRALIGQRASRIPLQHLLGTQEFMGLEFLVSPAVLIPRQDTETLVERVLADGCGGSLLDMCAGSGCIAVSLAVLGSFRQVTAVDISPEALAVARRNRERLLSEETMRERGMTFSFVESDLFSGLPRDVRYDVIVSNPPYIPSAVIDGLEPEVRDHEPRLALDGTEDGLAFYRRLAGESGRYLAPSGRIYLEIGCDQGEAVSRLLREAGFVKIEIIKDIPGLDRVVAAVWPQEGTHV